MELSPRNDKDLAFMLRFENVAWYENGKVRILDRRIYPIETKFVVCTDYREVVQCIADMVTQSEGPYVACLMGMALAAYQVRNEPADKLLAFMRQAAFDLSHARPTTSARMQKLTGDSLAVISAAAAEGKSGSELVDAAFGFAYDFINGNYALYDRTAKEIVPLFPDNGAIMTQCFAGTIIGTMLRECRRQGKDIRLFCCETRPYYQGARLTASCCCEMGFDTTVICDNMPAYTMQTKDIDVFTSAADVITCDGHVVNKVGTFQIALAANHLGIPYYVTGEPDPAHKSTDKIVIEERDGNQVIHSLGIQTVMDGVKGYYPAFDITPPELVKGIVTDRGIYTPDTLIQYFDK